jgi:hypothetical protein
VIRLLHQQIAGLRRQLADHPLYHQILSVEDLRIFLESHVFAVWDFMSLLKYLQRELTSVDVPWLPATAVSGRTTRLINEIVLREESDELPDGRILSHFQIYRESMTSVGANTAAIDELVRDIERGKSVNEALSNPSIPRPAAAFVQQTFSVIESGHLPAIAATFAYGREEVIREVLQHLLPRVSEALPGLTLFQVLLDRHLALDAERHAHLSGAMIEEICGASGDSTADRWQEARLALWDGILAQLDQSRPSIAALAR